MSKKQSQRAFVAALVAGILAIPAFAFGAASLMGSTPGDGAATAATAVTASLTPALETVVEPAAIELSDDPADLARACGPDGTALVERELDATITPLEQAALDALRPICADAGQPLPDAPAPPAPQEVVIVETVVASPPTTDPSSSVSYSDDDDDEEHGREHNEDDDDDDHDEDEGHDEDDD